MTRPLPPEEQARFNALVRKGREAEKSGDVALAERWYLEAWNSLPEPKLGWAEEDAKFCSGAVGNPFVHLRLGQCLLETGQRDRALDELARAYMGAGREIFQDEDPKYLADLAKVMKPPPGRDSP